MRKAPLIFALIFICTFSIHAQQKAGNILGKVTTSDGQILPGVLITLTSDVSGKMTAVSNEQGIFRFVTITM